MATEAELRGRIQRLNRQLTELREQQERIQTENLRRIDQQMQKLRAEYSRSVERMQEETEAACTARLRALEQDMSARMGAQLDALARQSEELARQQEAKLRELEQCNEELRSLLKRARRLTEEASAQQSQLAEEALQEMQKSRDQAADTPHEFFCAGDFDVIDSQAQQISQEIAAKMYQAAAAEAACIKTDFELLQTRVEQGLHEWLLTCREYARIVRMLWKQVEALETQPVRTLAGVFTMSEIELNFWSSGTYLPFKAQLRQALEMVETVDRIGAERYLKQAKEGRRAIYSSLRQAHAWVDTLAGIRNCVLSERVLSDERLTLGKSIAQALRAVDYQIVRIGFRPPEPAMAQASWYPKKRARGVDPMNSFELQMRLRDEDVLHIALIPIRRDGVAVENECVLWLEQITNCDPKMERQILDANVGRVTGLEPMHCRVRTILGADRAAKATKLERDQKKQPDPSLQIRRISRKYA